MPRERLTIIIRLVRDNALGYVRVELNVKSPAQVVIDSIDDEIYYDSCSCTLAFDQWQIRLPLTT